MGDPPFPAPGTTENDVLDEKKIVETEPAPAGRLVHVCSAVEDRTVLHALVKQLTGVRVTHAGDIRAGGTMDVERRALLDAADVIVLLVSADFVASPEHKTDVVRALEQHAAKATQLVPVLCRPCTWDGLPYAGLLALPRDKQPIVVERKVREDAPEGGSSTVIEHKIREDALAEVAREIRMLVAEPTEIDAACPFPGLEFFDEDRAADFFGREAQITEALAQLSEARPARRWLQIDGPSGAGKSSFARAGIVPAVRAGKLGVGPKAWITVVMRPGYDPIMSLAEALVKDAKPPLDVKGSLDAVTRALSSSTTAFKSFLREHAPDAAGVLLLVDQLEETFTLAHADENGVKQFDALLATALDDWEGPLVLVTTIRSDFVARMGELPALEAKLATQAVRYYLRPMDEAGLRAAIRKPAERAGLVYDEGLVDRIVADASTSRGALPLVAHVLEALHARREGLGLTARAYDLVGGVAGALAKSADAIIDSLDDDDRDRARKVLLRLVKIGRGNEDTRQTATREGALGAAGGGPEAERVLARLSGGRVVGLGGTTSASGRLLVVSGEAGKERVDLVHEALIQRWERLRAWIKDARDELELRDDVEEAARIWDASGQPSGGLPKGVALARFRSASSAGLKETARWFLAAAEKAEKRTAELRQQRELEKHRAAEDRTKFQRKVIVGLVGFLILLVIAGAGLILQKNEARRQTEIAEGRRFSVLATAVGAQHFPQQQLLLAVEAWGSSRAAGVPFFVEVEQALQDAVTGTGGMLLGYHGGELAGVAFSSDGKRIVTASYDKTARVWNADGSGEPIITLRGHEGYVTSASFSSDGKRIVTASYDKTARVWNADGSEKLIALLRHDSRVTSAAFSPDGLRVVTSSDDKTVRVWNADGVGEPLVLRGHQAPVTSAEFSPDGNLIVTASEDKTVRVWNADGVGEPLVLKGHEDRVWSAAFGPDSKRIITASGDGTARVWNADGAGQPLVLRGHADWVSKAIFSPDGRYILTASNDRTAGVWDLTGRTAPRVLRGHENFVTCATFSPDGGRILTGSLDKTIRAWTMPEGGDSVAFRGHEREVASATFSPDGMQIVTGSYDKTAKVWNVDGTGEPFVLDGHDSWVNSVAFSPDGKRIVTASSDTTARVWNADGTGEPFVFRGHKDHVRSAAFSPDGKRIVTASDDGTARVWSVEGKGDPTILQGHEGGVTSAAFSPDGKFIVTSSADGTARIWNTVGVSEPLILRGHEMGLKNAVFSSDGRRILTSSYDTTLRVWNADGTGEPLVLRGHGNVVAATFSPDGKRIITATISGMALVWNADGTGEPLVLRHHGMVQSAIFSLDGKRVVTASSDGTVRLWTTDGDALVRSCCTRVGRNFTREEWRRFFGDVPYRKTCDQWPEAPMETATPPATPTLLPSTVLPETGAPSLLPSSSAP